MGVEIERKFLVRGGAWRRAVERSTRMVQGYLGGDRCSVRVRVEADAAFLNVKSKTLGAKRSEYEVPLPLADAQAMLDEFCSARVEKVRHVVPHGGRRWEVDEFLGENAGLVVAEIELGDIEERFEEPEWLGSEVTAEKRYYNVNLVAQPFALWPDRAALRYED
jgi:adenylate cyclase